MSTESNKKQTDVPIAIVGMSCLFPKASGLKGYWRVLRTGVDCIEEVPSSHWAVDEWFDADPKSPDRTYCRRGGFIDAVRFDPTEFQMPPTALEATDTSQILGLVVAKAALEDAGYDENRVFDREKTSVILGVTGCLELVIPLGARLGHPIWRQALKASGVSDPVAEEVVSRISSAYVPWQENSFPGLLGNVVAGRIANRLDLHGTNCVVDAACASSNSAAHLAALELAAGRADMVVTGGVDTFNDVFMYMCFSKTPALSPSGDCRPFSAQGDGTLLGEGIGMVVLKRLSDAERDGDRIYAVIRGIGTSSDGEGQAIYAPSSDGQKRCLERAYENAGVDPATVGLVEAHGTGTKVGDVIEFEALRSVYGARRSDHGWCALGSVKSQIGHTKAAAGAAGIIKAALALHHKVLPPTLKAAEPNPKMRVEESPFYLSGAARPWLSAADHPRRAALSAFGFGGSNFHIVLEEHDAHRASPAWDGSVEIIALSADTPAALRDALEACAAAATAEEGREALARAAHESRCSFQASQPHRLVLVVGSDLLGAFDQARAALDGRASVGDAFVGEGPRDGKVVFLFPGQGSQYVEMGRELACIFPEMLASLEAADRAVEGDGGLGRFIFPSPATSDAARSEQLVALTRTDRAQPALGAIEAGMLDVLRRFGLEPDLACGHSYGELVALHAAGSLSTEALHRLSHVRGDAMARLDGDRGTMVAVGAALADVEALIAARGLEVRLANRNAPRQAILSGTKDAIAAASAACREQGWAVQPLKVSAAFHSPLVAPAREPFRAALDAVDVTPARFPVFANHGGRAYPTDAAEARALLADQIVSTVDFVGVVENVYAAGGRIFVEVGPRAALSGMVAQILGNRPHVRCAVDASAGRDGGLVDLARVLARCAAAGAHIDLRAWETAPKPARKKRMEVTLVGANYRAPNKNGAESVPRPPSSNGRTAGAAPRVESTAPAPPTPATPSTPWTSVTPVSTPATPAATPFASPAPPQPATPVAPAPIAPVDGGLFVEAFRSIQTNIQALQTLQQETASAHQRFLEGQELAQRTFQQVVEGQQRLVDRLLSGGAPTAGSQPSVFTAPLSPLAAPVVSTFAPPPVPASSTAAPAPVVAAAVATVAPATPVSPAAAVPVAAGAASATPAASGLSAERLAPVLLALVADKTGYPQEMLHLDMDLESDLGIDSIKRVEILAGMEERAPEAGRIETDKMGSLRTLRQVVELLSASAPCASAPPVAAPAAAVAASNGRSTGTAVAERAADLLLDVIADKTGYPREMLGLDMDLESDLGIDSIKRVEILAAMEERLPEAGRVETDRMGSLRTLRQVLDALVPPAAAPAADPLASRNGKSANGRSASSSNGHAGASSNGNGAHAVVSTNGHPAASNGASSNGRSTQAEGDGSVALARQIVGVVEATAPAGAAAPSLAPGHELRIVDDASGLSAALVARARAAGLEARLVSLDEAAQEGSRPCGGLVVVAPVRAAQGWVERASIDDVTRAFLAVSRLAPALQAAPGGLLATVVRMDGAFGLRGGDFDPVLGALSGLPKTAAHEWEGARLRALDVAADEADLEAAADAVLAELARSGPLEVGLRGGRRFVLQTQSVAAQPSKAPLQAGDLVVVTGGARGVTAEAAVELARAWRPTLLLLGRSAEPTPEPSWLAGLEAEADCKKAILAHHFNGGARPAPAELERVYREYAARREISSTLARLRALGVTAQYASVDVRDAAALRAVIDAARAAFGPVRGIVHAAGVLADKRIADKTPAQFSSVLETKLEGLRALLAACPVDELRAVALFSSVTARFGRPGQVDYCMANEALNKIAGRMARSLPACKVVAMNWGPWDGGMVNDGLRREFARLGVGLIPLQGGARALVAELGESGDAVEVLIGDGFPKPDADASLHIALEMALSTDTFPFLDSHRLAGRPVVPVAMIIEWMGHAALHSHPGLRFAGVDDLAVLKGVALDGEAPLSLRFLVSGPKTTPDGVAIDVALRSDEGLHARGRVCLVSELPAAPRVAPAEGLASEPYPIDVTALYETRLFHGPHFHAIRAVDGMSGQGLQADLAAAPRPARWMSDPLRSDWIGEPLVLDGGLQLGLAWGFAQMDLPSLPTRVARYRQFVARFPKKGVRAWLEIAQRTRRSFTGDICFSDATGKLVARLEGVEWAADASLASAFEQGRPLKTHR